MNHSLIRTWRFYDFVLLFLTLYLDHALRYFVINSFIYWALSGILVFAQFLYLTLTVAEIDEGAIIFDYPQIQSNIPLFIENIQEYFGLLMVLLMKLVIVYSPLGSCLLYFMVPCFILFCLLVKSPHIKRAGVILMVLGCSLYSFQGFNTFTLALLALTGQCEPFTVSLMLFDPFQPASFLIAGAFFLIWKNIKEDLRRIAVILLLVSKIGFFIAMGDIEYGESERVIESIHTLYAASLFYGLICQPKPIKMAAELFLDM